MSTYGPSADAPDEKRINIQMSRIQSYMIKCGETDDWRTLEQIRVAMEAEYPGTNFPEPSISAQLRHLRKERFGAHLVEKRRVAGTHGLWEYKVSVVHLPDAEDITPFESPRKKGDDDAVE